MTDYTKQGEERTKMTSIMIKAGELIRIAIFSLVFLALTSGAWADG
jgi:hypothetical protein